MTSRHKLLATIVASYAIACLSIAGCLELVTERYQAAVEAAEDLQINGILNRQVEDFAWNRYAESVRDLARDISQESQLRRLVDAGDVTALAAALPQTWRRAALTSGDIVVCGVTALRLDGTVLAREGALADASLDTDIGDAVSQRQGIDRLKILTRVWTSQGRPILTVVHPIGGLRPVGYLVVHSDPLRALSKLDKQMGVGMAFWSVDSSEQLAAPDNWKPEPNAQLHDASVIITSPNGVPVMMIKTSRNVGGRVITMQNIRLWSFVSLIGLLIVVAIVSTALVLALTKRIAADEANERSKIALNSMSHGVAMFDAAHRLLVCNRIFADLYGLDPEHVKNGTTIRQLLAYSHARGIFGEIDFETFANDWLSGVRTASERTQLLADGRVISVARRPLPSGGLLSTTEDITERHRLNAQVEQQNRRLRDQDEKLRTQYMQLDAALNNIVQGVAMFDADCRLVLCNARYLQIYGLTPEHVAPGMTLRQIMERRVDDGLLSEKAAEDVIETVLRRTQDGKFGQYCRYLNDDRCIAITIQPMTGGGMVTTHQDITEQRRSEAKIAHIALHDTLTDLPNRALLNEQLDKALARAGRGEAVAVHVLDLDNFKAVNDTLGHPIGDKLLKIVADRLRTQVRDTDTIARMGGDEFAVIEHPLSQPADAIALARRLIEAVCQPYEIDGHQVIIGTSIGIAVGPMDGTTPEQLMRNADLALYRAKGDGRGTFHFFEPAMDAMMQARRVMEHDLRRALANGEFELHYQPMSNLSNDEIIGFEALLRWRHPEKGMIQPNAFIPLAEEIRLIVPLGEWVIREACATAADWPGVLKIAVNLSAAQFRSPELVNVVFSALASSGLAPHRLELEITESILLEGTERTLAILHQLRGFGVRIAMDDFGTGYSSLSYLQSFPFDKIKIDQSFVQGIVSNAGSLNIVRAVAALANGLGIAATAEGVETIEQLDIIRSEGCTEMQGFLLSKPLQIDEVRQLLLSKTTTPKSKEGVRAA